MQPFPAHPPPIATPAQALRIHHLNCISSRPFGGSFVDGATHIDLRARLTSHCLLIDTSDGLVLVDTGYGLRDVLSPESRLSPFFLELMRPEFDEEMTAIRQVQRLGFRAHDVRHIVLSHLDFDQAGGLDDFPSATVHLLRAEIIAATSQATALDRQRYRPQQWGNRDRWRAYEPAPGDTWMGMPAVTNLSGIDAEIALVPLPGHTRGHAGIAVRRERDWLFHAGDAYFHHQEIDLQHPRCTPGLALFQKLMEKDRAQRLATQERLRALRRAQGDAVQIFCAHDADEFVSLSGRSHMEPVPMAASHGRIGIAS